MGWMERMRIGCEERALAGLAWVARKRGRSEDLAPHLATGIEGEEAAFFYLRRKDYTVVARRWSSGEMPGDVDLIAWQEPRLCFIEVKTRTARDSAPAEITVDSTSAALSAAWPVNIFASCPRRPPRRSASMCSASTL